MATPAERDLESPTVRRVGAAASTERDAAAAHAQAETISTSMAIMISKDEDEGRGGLARARTFEGSSRQASVGGQNPPPRGGLALAGDQRYLPRAWPEPEGRHNVDRRERLGDGDL